MRRSSFLSFLVVLLAISFVPQTEAQTRSNDTIRTESWKSATYLDAPVSHRKLVTVAERINRKLMTPAEWYGQVTQSSTNAPSATVMHSMLGQTVTFARTDAGQYTIAIPDSFHANKWALSFTPADTIKYSAALDGTTKKILVTVTKGADPADGLFNGFLKLMIFR